MTRGLRTGLALAAGVAAYWLAMRPRLFRWGATAAELARRTS